MMTLEELGFTKDELQNRVVDQIVRGLLERIGMDEDGDEIHTSSKLKQQLDKKIMEAVNSKVSELAEKHILPNVSQMIENLALTETNKWGEAKGKSLTFIEYLVERAESYITEQVDYEGKGKAESSSYSWSGKQTRITYLIHKHLQYSIETAMKSALSVATSKIATGIHETVKLKLEEVTKQLQVNVKV